MRDIAIEYLRMEVDSVIVVRGRPTKKRVLQIIERSAEETKDLGVANDARFRRLSIEGEDKRGLARGADRVLYRGVAGYFVAPSHPLVTLVLLLLAATLARGVPRLAKAAPEWRSASPEPGSNPPGASLARRVHDMVLATEKAGTILLGGLASSFGAAARRKPGVTIGNPERVRSYLVAGLAWLEFLSYKVLIAVFLVALGNSNATVRQIFEAVVS